MKLKNLFKAFSTSKQYHTVMNTDDSIITKRIVQLHSRGNVNLIKGNYFTQKDIDEQLSQVLEYDFLKRH